MAINKSIIRRYLVLSALATALPVLAIGLVYDQLAGSVLEKLLGDKMTTHLTATTNRLTAYLEVRRYQVETLANYPGMAAFLSASDSETDRRIHALLELESDLPDLYGILFFDAQGRLLRAVPGQAAAGAPYWADRPFDTRQLPSTRLGETEILGPMPPSADGDSGWLLVRHAVHSARADLPAGSIALHVRLASLTEQLGNAGAGSSLQTLLRTPAGDFNTVAQAVPAQGRLVFGPAVVAGWQPLLELESSGLQQSFTWERRLLLLSALAGAGLVVLLFFGLSRHLRQRIDMLLTGTAALAAGHLDHRIADDGEDEITAVSQAFNDMSSKLKDYMDRALRIEKLAVLGEFAANMAHEIRNPLAALKTTVQALSRREVDPRRQALLADMEGEIDRLADVVSDFVNFGRPHQPRLEPVPVGEVLRRVATMIAADAQARQVHVSLQGDTALQPWVDRDHLLQIVLNLALNAVQATGAGGSVILRSHREGQHGDRVVVEVADTGCGIEPELLSRVSDPFFTTKTKGVGLGLSISRQLCELNGGQLLIDSTLGQGTSVRVVLPTQAPLPLGAHTDTDTPAHATAHHDADRTHH
jgi:two-component system, NtrC family, sensor histidine kinase HydH